jgi:hypothetical protein
LCIERPQSCDKRSCESLWRNPDRHVGEDWTKDVQNRQSWRQATLASQAGSLTVAVQFDGRDPQGTGVPKRLDKNRKVGRDLLSSIKRACSSQLMLQRWCPLSLHSGRCAVVPSDRCPRPRSTLTAMTQNVWRWRPQPPTQVTCQSRERLRFRPAYEAQGFGL